MEKFYLGILIGMGLVIYIFPILDYLILHKLQLKQSVEQTDTSIEINKKVEDSGGKRELEPAIGFAYPIHDDEFYYEDDDD